MSRTTQLLGDAGAAYLSALSSKGESDVKARLRARTDEMELANMQISPEQARLMALIVRMLDGKRAIEVGVFTGYSALCVAEALPVDGKLVACDISREYTDIARPFWQEAGVAERIDLRVGPAADSLQALLDAGEAGTYDFAFIDADKENNERYYELCLELLRPGGVLGVDNALAGGRVFDAADERGLEAQAVNARVMADPRVEAAMVPISDGLLLARKRG